MRRCSANRLARKGRSNSATEVAEHACIRWFSRDESGGMIIFGVMLFGLMLAIGGISFDIMRYETHRDRLQATLDRAVLAAASMQQNRDPATVVLDYFEKAGMSEFISTDDIVVTSNNASRRVEAEAKIHVPLHHGLFNLQAGQKDTLVARAQSAAEESIGDVEISMVLDLSWSMLGGSFNGQSRLENLKDAAQGFLDTVYDNADSSSVITTSVIPYGSQVSMSRDLAAHFNRNDYHEDSFCLEFTEADFSTTEMEPRDATGAGRYYTQDLHFDPWTNENYVGWWEVGNNPFLEPNCFVNPTEHILPFETNKETIKTHIQNMNAMGNTSTDVGAKWGAALLDPSMADVVTSMVAEGTLPSDAQGRPFSYSESLAMKAMVIMTDGFNTNQPYMGAYRSGESFVWRFTDGNAVYYSIWPDGEGSTPDFTYETETVYSHTETTYTCNAWYLIWCISATQVSEDIYVEQAVPKWFTVYNLDVSAGVTEYMWTPTPFDLDMTDGNIEAERLNWEQVWAAFPPRYFSWEVLAEMASTAPSGVEVMASYERSAFGWSIDYVSPNTKNSRMEAICDAAKAQGVLVFTVGMQVTSNTARRVLKNCASSESHYYNVETIDIDKAFQSIAGQINQLRLIQ